MSPKNNKKGDLENPLAIIFLVLFSVIEIILLLLKLLKMLEGCDLTDGCKEKRTPHFFPPTKSNI